MVSRKFTRGNSSSTDSNVFPNRFQPMQPRVFSAWGQGVMYQPREQNILNAPNRFNNPNDQQNLMNQLARQQVPVMGNNVFRDNGSRISDVQEMNPLNARRLRW